MSISSEFDEADWFLLITYDQYFCFQEVIYVKDWIVDEVSLPPGFVIGLYRTVVLVYSKFQRQHRMIYEYQFNFAIKYRSFALAVPRKM